MNRERVRGVDHPGDERGVRAEGPGAGAEPLSGRWVCSPKDRARKAVSPWTSPSP